MSKKSKKKSLTKTLSGEVPEFNRTGGVYFEKVVGELQRDIQQVAVDFNGRLQELDVIEAEKKNSKIRYQRNLDGGDEQGMSLCLSEIRGRNVRAEELRAELAIFPGKVKEFYARQTKIFVIARGGQSKAESDLREAEKVLKLTEEKVKRCYALQGLINNVNKDIEDLIRAHKKEKKNFEDEIKPPRSNKDGFWLEVDDPFAEGTLRLYQKLKDVNGLAPPCLLSFKDKETTAVDEAGLSKSFERSEELQSEFADVKSYVAFKSRVIVQVLENYILRAAGGGDRRREFAAKVILNKCK